MKIVPLYFLFFFFQFLFIRKVIEVTTVGKGHTKHYSIVEKTKHERKIYFRLFHFNIFLLLSRWVNLVIYHEFLGSRTWKSNTSNIFKLLGFFDTITAASCACTCIWKINFQKIHNTLMCLMFACIWSLKYSNNLLLWNKAILALAHYNTFLVVLQSQKIKILFMFLSSSIFIIDDLVIFVYILHVTFCEFASHLNSSTRERFGLRRKWEQRWEP